MDKPLDIRIVQLVDALNQIGIDPTSVKQLIEELLCEVDVSQNDLTDEQMQHYLDLHQTGERAGGGKTSPWKPEVPTPINETLKVGDRIWWNLTMNGVIEKAGDREYSVKSLDGTVHRVGAQNVVSSVPCENQQSQGPIHSFNVGDPVWWDIGMDNLHVKQGTIHSLDTPDPSKVFVKVEGDDPPHWVSVGKLNKTEVTPLPALNQRWSAPNQTGTLFKQGDKVWFFDVYSGRVHGTIYRFSDGTIEGKEMWGGRAEIKVTKMVKTSSTLSGPNSDCLYPNLADLQKDNGDIVDEAGGLTGLRLKIGQSVKWEGKRYAAKPPFEGILIGFQKTRETGGPIILGVVWSEGRILYLFLHHLEVVTELSREDGDDLEDDSSGLDDDGMPDDKRFYIGDRVWFWDPLGKRIINGNIHRLDTNLPGEIVLVQQFEGLHPRWVSCQVEELHRDTGRIITKNVYPFKVGKRVWWFTELNEQTDEDRRFGTIAGFLTYEIEEGNPDAIIIEDDRQHSEWPVDEYKLHFVDVMRLGYA